MKKFFIYQGLVCLVTELNIVAPSFCAIHFFNEMFSYSTKCKPDITRKKKIIELKLQLYYSHLVAQNRNAKIY